ncbi:MAG TPA: DUF192 domain-containing protein [Ktedonobacterales bacterium]|nr:DUF192 domain-containing protein [Ktedonobacterales bacterium]
MQTVRVINTTRAAVLAERAGFADSIMTRTLGLMGQANLPAGTGLVLDPCTSIHMFFMRFAIDALYVAQNGAVLRVVPHLRPWGVGPIIWRARYVVELPAGTAARTGTQAGDTLRVEPIASRA